jgi:ADP-ribose pyrophosphatase YjhB (NUDIX family)
MNPVAEKMFAKKKADTDTRIRVGVGVFVLDDQGRILLEKRSDCGLWGLAGGRIEPGESAAEAAIREVREETGFSVQITRLIGVYSEPSERIVTYLDNGDVVQLVDIILEGRIAGGHMACSFESEEIRFFEAKALPPEIAPPAVSPIRDYLQGLTGVLR